MKFDASRFDLTKPRSQVDAQALSAAVTESERKSLTGVQKMKFHDNAIVAPFDKHFSLKDALVHDDEIGTQYFENQLSFGVRMETLKRHLQSKCMHSVFHTLRLVEKTKPDPQVSTKTVVYKDVEVGPYMLEDMMSLTLEEVQDSVKIYQTFSSEGMDLENLTWSHALLLNCCDEDLRRNLSAKLLSIPADRQGGPTTLMLLYMQIMKHSKKTARAIIQQLTKFDMKQVAGEDIDVVNSYITGCIQRLDPMGSSQTNHLPEDIHDIVLDIMLRSSVQLFTDHFRVLQSVDSAILNSPESIMAAASSKFHDLTLSKEWLPTSKSKSSFQGLGGAPRPPATPGPPPTNPAPKDGAQYDKAGRLIDRTPPASGQPATRDRDDGKGTESWCSICNRWGNHGDDGHNAFLENRKKFRAKMKALHEGNNNASDPEGTNQGGANQAQTGGTAPADGRSPGSAMAARMSQLRDPDHV